MFDKGENKMDSYNALERIDEILLAVEREELNATKARAILAHLNDSTNYMFAAVVRVAIHELTLNGRN
jgi:hypothetical protein